MCDSEKNEVEQECEVENVVQEALEQCCMIFLKKKGRLCTCRYRGDDTGDCLLDMLIRGSQPAERWRCGDTLRPADLPVWGLVDGIVCRYLMVCSRRW